MKATSLVFIAILASTAFVRAQDEPTAVSRESTPVPAVYPTTARILGPIPDGTPPPPTAPKPEFIIPQRDVLNTTTHEQGGRTITIREIKPIALPPPPDPEPALPNRMQSSAFAARVAEYRATHPQVNMLSLSAMVYRSPNSPARSLVTCWPSNGAPSFTFWSSADFALIAGIRAFADSSGQNHSLFMSWGNMDTTRLAARYARLGKTYQPPAIPAFPEGKATYQITGTQPAADLLVAIQSLHDLYNTEHDRLQTAYQGREQARLQQEADLKANPPRPQDITLNYWRTEKPAPAKGGTR